MGVVTRTLVVCISSPESVDEVILRLLTDTANPSPACRTQILADGQQQPRRLSHQPPPMGQTSRSPRARDAHDAVTRFEMRNGFAID